MSLIPAMSMMPGFLLANDERITQDEVNKWNAGARRAQVRPWEDGMLWPRGGMMGGDPSVPMSVFGSDPVDVSRWATIPEESGGQGQLKLRGVTRNSTGAPLGSCVVRGFRTSDALYVGAVTSDAGGYYELPSQYPSVNHYLTAYKAGSPDVAGTTVNTLVPS